MTFLNLYNNAILHLMYLLKKKNLFKTAQAVPAGSYIRHS